MEDNCAVILAAGEGTRMRSRKAKVLHSLLGRPLMHYPVDLCLIQPLALVRLSAETWVRLVGTHAVVL